MADNEDALSEVNQAFRKKVMEDYDVPVVNTIDPDSYISKPFRYHLDNLLSISLRAHNEYRIVHHIDTTDITVKEFNRFVKICKGATDACAARIFHKFAMINSPRVAWWVASPCDWIKDLPRNSIDFSEFTQSSTGIQAPSLPIAACYKEALALRIRAESDPDVMAPDDALLSTKIAKYFYSTMKEAINLVSPEPDQGETARIKQCSRKLVVLAASLEEASGEDEDFIDILLSMIPNNTLGPDGERLSTKTIKKGLGSAMNTGLLYDIFKAIPAALSGATDEESAKNNLMNHPSVKKILQAGGKEGSIDNIFEFIKGYGIVPQGESSSAPINVSSQPAPTTRKSVKK